MKLSVNTVEEYIENLPEERREPIKKLRKIILEKLPNGFEEQITYGMIGYVVPHSIYPEGYHVNSKEPLPFINLASQKNHIALYHMGLYTKPGLDDWFKKEYKKRVTTKIDMGKSCIRFKKMDQIPYDLVKELCKKITVDEYIVAYKKTLKN